MKKGIQKFLPVAFLFIFMFSICLPAQAANIKNPPLLIPDLACTFNILSSIMDGNTFEFGIIDVYEVAGDATVGTITIRLEKDDNLDFVYDPSLAIAGLYIVNNAVWTYDDSDPDFHVFTLEDTIPANGKSSIGFIFNYDTQEDGEVVYTVSIASGSGGDTNESNNVDVEAITHFIK